MHGVRLKASCRDISVVAFSFCFRAPPVVAIPDVDAVILQNRLI
jgi:hypothetical protein